MSGESVMNGKEVLKMLKSADDDKIVPSMANEWQRMSKECYECKMSAEDAST